MGAVAIGSAALRLGAGRSVKDDMIDHAVGVRCLEKRGATVEQGATLAEVHARSEAAAEQAVTEVLAAYEIADESPDHVPVVLETIA